jgi:hypothetical protein
MITKTTDFKLDAYIPNRDDAPNSDILGNEPELQGMIDKWEPEVLVELLGYDMKEEFITAIDWAATPPALVVGADQKWMDLYKGKENYRGIKELLVNYIFYKFMESDDDHYATVGTQKEDTDSATRVSMRAKAIQAYRRFFKLAIGNFYGVQSGIKPSIWGNMRVVLWSGFGYGGSNFKSLYEWLMSKSTDFQDWSPTDFRNKNYFDI